jgi:uncharacterized membrane protein
MQRLLNLSDGVFSIAMTLLVFGIGVPELHPSTDGELARQIMRLLPKLVLCGFSFVLIARFWYMHHYVFRRIKHCDQGMVTINNVFLLFVALFPFPVSLLGKYGEHTFATAFYAINMAIIGLSCAWLLWYAANRPGFLHDHLNAEQVRRKIFLYLAVPGTFLISIPLAYVNVRIAWFCWLVAILIRTKIERRVARSHH